MRILLAVKHAGRVGGAEAYQYAVSRSLIQSGHDVAWLCEAEGGTTAAGGTTPESDTCQHLWRAGQPDHRKRAVEWAPDVAFLQGLDSAAVEEWLIDSFKTVLFAHNYQGTCPAGTKRHSFPRNTACARNISPVCLALYLPRRCGGRNPFTLLELYRTQMAHRALLDRVDAIAVGSTHMMREYSRLKLAGPRLQLVPLGIEASDADPPGPRQLGERIRIGFVGRLTDIKGCHILLRAIPLAARRIDRQLEVTIVGDGPEKGRLTSLADLLGIKATFTGWLGKDSTAGELDSMDLLGVPSIWGEPFGLVGVEAARRGIPSVAFDVGGIGDWLLPGKTGELAPGARLNPEGMAEAIVHAVADEEHYTELSRGALAHGGSFSLERHVEVLETLFTEVSER